MPGRARRALFTEQDATDYCRGHRDGLGVATGKRRHRAAHPPGRRPGRPLAVRRARPRAGVRSGDPPRPLIRVRGCQCGPAGAGPLQARSEAAPNVTPRRASLQGRPGRSGPVRGPHGDRLRRRPRVARGPLLPLAVGRRSRPPHGDSSGARPLPGAP